MVKESKESMLWAYYDDEEDEWYGWTEYDKTKLIRFRVVLRKQKKRTVKYQNKSQ